MTEIPEDIRKAAQACYEFCEYGDSGEIVECIAGVILAERNRCIEKINDNVPTGGWERGTEDIQFHAALMVRAIMDGEA